MSINLRIQGLLLAVIFFEGFIVLAAELLAIRLMLPFVGSGTEVVSIIISAVLMPLAIGYHRGGHAYAAQRRKAQARGKKPLSNREMLSRNALQALIVLCFGLSYPVLEVFFTLLSSVGITNRLVTTSLYAALFLVGPVYMLAQTIPLISRYFRHIRLHHITGKMLFFSTIGSFLGSIVTTLLVMPFLGAHYAAMMICAALGLLVVLPLRRRLDFSMIMALFFVGLAWQFNAPGTLLASHVVSNNGYNMAAVRDNPAGTARHLILNNSASSAIGLDGEDRRHSYIRRIEELFIPTAPDATPMRILVLGAGGFTLGRDDRHNDYTYVDIDPALKDVSEHNFLQKPLADNQHFIAQSARAFLNEDRQDYDLIVIDTYSHVVSIPTETITVEFLQKARDRLKARGIIVANVISTAFAEDAFTQHYMNGFAAVFPNYWRQLVDTKRFRPNSEQLDNFLFIARNTKKDRDTEQYHDLRNRYLYDR